MAGGGGRLGVHLGTHAAMCEAGRVPDVLLGTCGGALVAALVHAEPDPARQLAWLAGPEMYRFWSGVRLRARVGLGHALRGVLRRLLDPRLAARVPDLDRDALFEVAGEWPRLAWRDDGRGTDVVVLGARLLFAPGEAGARREGRALMEPVAIASPRAAATLAGAPAAVAHGVHAGSSVARALAVVEPDQLALHDAVRISMTDMVYLAPAAAAGARWLGGAVDLLPVELAARLADDVWIDRKDPIPRWTMAPAWRAVLGIDARRRQREVDDAPDVHRIDHRGVDRALRETVLRRRLAWPAGPGGAALRVQPCGSEADYRRLVEQQFAEGRRRARAALAGAGA